MAGVGAGQQQDRAVGRGRRLQARGHLARLHRVDPPVGVAGLEQHRRIGRAIDHMMIGRVGIERVELRLVLDRAELGRVERPVRVVLDPQHVVDADRRHDGAGEARMLGQHGAHQQPAVAAAHQRQPFVRGDLAGDQFLGDRGEIVEHVLLPGQRALLMPDLAIFAAAADIGDDEHAAGIQPQARAAAGETWVEDHAIAAIAIQQRRCRAVRRRALLADQGIGHLGAVLRRGEGALDLGIVELDGAGQGQRRVAALAGRGAIALDLLRLGIAFDREQQVAAGQRRDIANRRDRWGRQRAERAAVRAANLDRGRSAIDLGDIEPVLGDMQRAALRHDRGRVLRHDHLGMGQRIIARCQLQYLPARRALARHQIERTVGAERGLGDLVGEARHLMPAARRALDIMRDLAAVAI